VLIVVHLELYQIFKESVSHVPNPKKDVQIYQILVKISCQQMENLVKMNVHNFSLHFPKLVERHINNVKSASQHLNLLISMELPVLILAVVVSLGTYQ
jgi:hypothetical protein